MADARFDPGPALAPLKAFQRATVDHVCRRLLTDADATRQFLVADEVGLGKTMVARGVIARTIEALWDKVPRIDIIYVCSNGAIAAQNLARLNVMEREAKVLPTRLTLLWQQHMRGALSQLPMASGPWIWLPTDHSRRPAQMDFLEGLQP